MALSRFRPHRGTRVLLYDPSSGGGIGHYTDLLASSLTRAAMDVLVATPANGSSATCHSRYRIVPLGKPVWLKKELLRICGVRGGSGPDPKPVSRRQRFVSRVTQANVTKFAATVWSRVKFFTALLLAHPRIIHYQWMTTPKEEYYFLKVLKWFRFKVIFTAHNLLPHDAESEADWSNYQRLYQTVDRLIVHAERTKSDMTRMFRIDGARITVIPHGSYDRFFDPSRPASRVATRQMLGISTDARVLLFFGLIRRYKGLEYLVRAFDQVSSQLPNTTLVVAGQIGSSDVHEYEYYRDLLESLRQRSDVRCLTEHIPDARVGGLFAASDLVVLPYVRCDTSGVLLVAYAAGKPVVATDTGALGEMVEPRRSGVLVPPRDSEALAQGIKELLQDPGALADMGRHARHLAETRYSWTRIAAQTSEVYRSILETETSGIASSVMAE